MSDKFLVELDYSWEVTEASTYKPCRALLGAKIPSQGTSVLDKYPSGARSDRYSARRFGSELDYIALEFRSRHAAACYK